MSWSGLNFDNTSTCKSQILDVLSNILPKRDIDRLKVNNYYRTIPRVSGPTESVFLFTTGPILPFKNKSGHTVWSRDGKDKEVKLFFTIPPQMIVTDQQDTLDRLIIPESLCKPLKRVVARLQQLEWVIRNADVAEELNAARLQLVNRIIQWYMSFSDLSPKRPIKKSKALGSMISDLFSEPTDPQFEPLVKKVQKAEDFLKSIVACMNLEVDDLSSFWPNDDDISVNTMENMISRLSVVTKQEICDVIGIKYVEMDMFQELKADLEPRADLELRAF